MNCISQNTLTLIELLFPKDKHIEVKSILEEYCYFLRYYKMEGNLDRFTFAQLKLSINRKKGKINKLLKAVDLGKTDYRDLLVSAGFGNDINIHNKWFLDLTKLVT